MKHLWWAPLSLILACHLNGHLLSGPIERPPTSVSVETYTAQAPTPVANELTFGVDSANGNSYTTASISPCANCLVVAWVVSKDATIPPPAAETPTLSGASMTWSNVLSNTFGANAETRLTMFRAQSASSGSGALTIDFAGDEQDIVKWNVVEFDSVRTGGNGINAMLQPAAADHGSQTLDTLTVELGRFEHAGNAAVGGFAIDGTTGKNAGDGFTILNPAEPFPFFLGTLIEWKTSNDSTVDISLDGGDELAGTAFELGVQPRCNAKVEWSVIGSPTTVRVYRDSASLGLFSVLDSTTQNEYTDSLAPEGSRYYPEAFFATTGNSFAGDTVTAPPCRPSNIVLDPITVDSIVVTWADSSGIEDSTHVERCTGAGCSDFSQVASVGPNVTEYRDGGLSGGTTYRYQLRTSKDSLFSIYSPTGTGDLAPSATTPSADVIAFDNSETAFDTTATDVLKWKANVTTAATDTPRGLVPIIHNEAGQSTVLRDRTIVFSSLAVLENGSNLSTYSTGSLSPGTDALLLGACGNRDDDGTMEVPDSASGFGLNWAQEATQLQNDRRVTLYRAMGTPSNPDTFDCFYPDQQTHGWISLTQADSVLTTGTDGADAVVQSATANCGSCATETVTLASFADATNNAALGVILVGAGEDISPGAGFTELNEAQVGAGTIETEWQLGEDTSVDWTWTTSTDAGAIAVELAADTVTEADQPDLAVTLTYGNQSCTSVLGQTVTDGSGFGNSVNIWFCDEDVIAAGIGDDTIRADPSDADADIVGASLSFARVARVTPEATVADSAIDVDEIRLPLSTLTDDAWIVQAATMSDSISSSALFGATDRYEVLLGTDGSTNMSAAGATWGPISPAGSTDSIGHAVQEVVGRLALGGLVLVPVTTATGPPDAPTSLVATAEDAGSAGLTWTDNSDNENGFEVQRCEDTPDNCPDVTGYAIIDTAATDATSYTDVGLSGGTTYTWRIRAVNSIGQSAFSNEDSATTPSASGTMTIATTGYVNDSLAAAGNPLPAFWGADGAGATALYSGSPTRCDTLPVEVLAVTNTNSTGAGSFRQAILDASSTARTYIVFKTGGQASIFSDGKVTINKDCIYVMGQSAPGDGFSLEGYIVWELSGGVSDFVGRYVALYGGDMNPGFDFDVLVIGSGADHIALDHMSVQGANDEIFRIDQLALSERAEYGTFSNMVMGITRKTTAGWGTWFDKDTTAAGDATGMGPFSFVRSLLADGDHRLPSLGAQDTTLRNGFYRDETVDLMIRNWQLSGKASKWTPSGKIDQVSTTYRRAFTNNGLPPVRIAMFFIPSDTTTQRFEHTKDAFHLSDVICIDEQAGEASCGTDYGLLEQVHDGSALPDSMKRPSRHPFFTDSLPWPVTPLGTSQHDALLDNGGTEADVGSWRGISPDGSQWLSPISRRPSSDSLLIDQWFNGGGNQESDADRTWADWGGVPTHAAGTAWTDADGDNLPDDYETACSVTDPTVDDDGDGVPNIQDLFDGHDLEGINVTFSPGETIDSIQVEKDVGSGFALDTTLIWPDTVLTVRRFQRDTIYRGKKFIGGALDATTAPDTAKCY